MNAYAKEFIKWSFEEKDARVQKARDFLSQRLETLKAKVEQSEQQMSEYARDNELLALASEQTTTHQKFGLFANEVASADSQLLSAQARFQQLSTASIDRFPDGLKTNNIEGLSSKLLQLEQDLATLTSKFGDSWPHVIQRRSEIELVKKQLTQEKQVALDAAREQARLEYELAQDRRNLFAGALETQKEAVGKLNEATIEYNILKREVESDKVLYDGLLGRLKEAGISPGQELGNINIIELGVPALIPYSPQIFRNLTVAGCLGLFLGVVLAFLFDYFDSSITSQEELETLLGVPTLSVIPEIPESVGSGHRKLLRTSGVVHIVPQRTASAMQDSRVFSQHVYSPGFQESLRDLAASILLSHAERPPQKILITSSVPKEGKSFLVAHLGVTLAQSGASTIMVESDLRKPRLASRFGNESTAGLSLFLAGSTFPEILETGVENLHLICAGPRPRIQSPYLVLRE